MLLDMLWAMLNYAWELRFTWDNDYALSIVNKAIRHAGLNETLAMCYGDLTNNNGDWHGTFAARFDFVWSFIHDWTYGTDHSLAYDYCNPDWDQ